MMLGLGTVQFGADYGVSNDGGKVPPPEVASVLASAEQAGIVVLDTAAAYGDSESVLGSALWPDHRFRVVTKIPPLDQSLSPSRRISTMRDFLQESLKRLRMKSVYGVLLHRAADAAGANGAELSAAFQQLKEEGLAKKVGVSVYGADELEAVLENFMPGLVQLPSNAIDQRLLRDGWLARLSALGVEVHVRSVFLQGLLLMPPSRRHGAFSQFRTELDRFDRFCGEYDLTPLEAALGYVRHLPAEVAIVGVTKRIELEEIARAMEAAKTPTLDAYSELACDDVGLVNPAMWRLH
ncbi:MAG: aryl-alcohol dehydrogenase [Gammaproteobacteria bacterium]|nr:aryl-alcohol dehydrogenase [Gammaproteobacteria bacterium]